MMKYQLNLMLLNSKYSKPTNQITRICTILNRKLPKLHSQYLPQMPSRNSKSQTSMLQQNLLPSKCLKL